MKTNNIDKTMKQTIEIEVPEGKEAVWKDGKVVFEDIKPELPKSWEEFCNKHKVTHYDHFINSDSSICNWIGELYRNPVFGKNLVPSAKAAKQHLALMQLHQLRDCYRQRWKPDWENKSQNKYYIAKSQNLSFGIYRSNDYVHFLSFPTKEIAEEFLRNFEELIKETGDLI